MDERKELFLKVGYNQEVQFTAQPPLRLFCLTPNIICCTGIDNHRAHHLAVQEALNMNESELHGRQIKVSAKSTNVPRMKQHPPRGAFNPYHGYPYRSYGLPYFPPYGGYGRVPRFRRPTR
ncbi:polyadenylate-binding protein 3-like [Lolium rigidum]|uniref:polyadenylate-binding protein 3-like n=1 Tax=Lolium rigidum TaxID=89674 RepID=UPI001F5C8124|nr:polyadenylate-binding protein 3-like [Lolium rigidum]XP_047087268.1 polyadenylate-binding protein 3-like [Lolium rigidum]